MLSNLSLPSKKETLALFVFTALFLLITGVFVKLRSEHIVLAVLFCGMFLLGKSSRKLVVALLPFVIFGISYDWMRIFPNYQVNPIDVAGLYNLEKLWFGISSQGAVITPCEYFSTHHHIVLDICAGFFYLCWVPVPLLFGICLYCAKRRELYLRFAMVFLLVNLIGFVGYYLHPAAPPWYVIEYGFEPMLNTPGNVAGLGRFDTFFGISVFQGIYGRNANVFAAVPSLHAAYMVVALCYALKGRCKWYVVLPFAIIMAGIWFTAVYSCHHYIIDVLLGICCALVGWLVFEWLLMRLPLFKRFFNAYHNYIR